MPRFQVHGIDIESGLHTRIVVDCPSALEAAAIAGDRGIEASAIDELGRTNMHSPNAPAPAQPAHIDDALTAILAELQGIVRRLDELAPATRRGTERERRVRFSGWKVLWAVALGIIAAGVVSAVVSFILMTLLTMAGIGAALEMMGG